MKISLMKYMCLSSNLLTKNKNPTNQAYYNDSNVFRSMGLKILLLI